MLSAHSSATVDRLDMPQEGLLAVLYSKRMKEFLHLALEKLLTCFKLQIAQSTAYTS